MVCFEWRRVSAFMNLSELHKLFDLLVVERAVLSIVLTDEVLRGETDGHIITNLFYSSGIL